MHSFISTVSNFQIIKKTRNVPFLVIARKKLPKLYGILYSVLFKFVRL